MSAIRHGEWWFVRAACPDVSNGTADHRHDAVVAEPADVTCPHCRQAMGRLLLGFIRKDPERLVNDEPGEEQRRVRIARLIEQIIGETGVLKLEEENQHLRESLNAVLEKAAGECDRVAAMLRAMKGEPVK